MFEKIFDRRNFVVILISFLFIVLTLRIADITIVDGEYYRDRADKSFLRSVKLPAKRGEIYDTNGLLLAGNMPSYTVQFLSAPQYADRINEVCINLLTLLENKDEDYLEFPIKIIDEKFYYTNSIQINEWLLTNGFSITNTAEEVYEIVRVREFIDESLDNYDAQKLMLYKGVSLPISVRQMKFLSEIKKDNFLKEYAIDEDTTAEEAFNIIKEKSSYKLNDKYRAKDIEPYTDEEALKIMTIRHAFKSQGYRKFVPIDIATNISKESAVIIQEMGMDFPGVSIAVEPIRDYQYGESAAHILGYMGKISSQREKEKYLGEDSIGYSLSDRIGKTGIEYEYENVLHGVDGNKYIYADVRGNYIGDYVEGIAVSESSPSSAGKDVYLTIDMELQRAVEGYLKYGLEQIRKGTKYFSKWGDYVFYDKNSFENAVTGAVVVVKVKTGEVLALASYPSYDLNLFSTGISLNDWNSLQPDNPRNPLAPRPLFNIATNTAVQPGSTFKPITVLAALEQGLNPNDKILTKGFVEIGKKVARCWLFRETGGSHGFINSYTALEVSCNYFMFAISRGWNYAYDRPLNFEMNTEILLDYAKRVGLGAKTGIEIFEVNNGVPDENNKKNEQLNGLWIQLNKELETYFGVDRLSIENEKEQIINTILKWADDYMDPDYNFTRNETIRRLMDLEPIVDISAIEPLAEMIYYDYFKQIAWRESDDLNLSIGQGLHQYTVAQMARYVATIANGGILNELTLIKDIEGEDYHRVEGIDIGLNDIKNLDAVKEGMRLVANGSRGSVRSIFKNFPIEVAAKTGTAQKEGRIPPSDEAVYVRENLEEIVGLANAGLRSTSEEYITIDVDELIYLTDIELKSRNAEVAELQLRSNKLEDGEEKDKLIRKIRSKVTKGYTTDGYVMRDILIEMSGDRITDEMIDSLREFYDPFAWFISFAPFDDPEIAVAILIPQGGHGSYAAPIVRDIYAKYFNLYDHDLQLYE